MYQQILVRGMLAARLASQARNSRPRPAIGSRCTTLGATRLWLILAALCALASLAAPPAAAQSIVKKIDAAQQRIEITVNTSRILTLEGKIPRAQVNNPDVLTVTPLSPNEIQISGARPGVTQLNLWNEKGEIFTLDVTVYGDVQELEATLKQLFPHSSVRALRISNSLVLTGYVDQPSIIPTVMRLSEDYAPQLINNISVGGVQQVLLHVQVMEVSRTKLRAMGFDFANLNGNDIVFSSISGLYGATPVPGGILGGRPGTGGDTFRVGVLEGSNGFNGFLRALRQNDLIKVLAEPKLVTLSGRPASFNAGGEVPYPESVSINGVSVGWRETGVTIDFLPIVLGNGTLRLEVRPMVREIDPNRSFPIAPGFDAPAFTARTTDTGVEMKVGQTLAIAGLVSTRIEARNTGIPFLADIPVLGAAFRSVEYQQNEIELLILVRPELVDPLDPHEVPHMGPGLASGTPSDKELYVKGWLEVPRCPGCGHPGCPDCGGQILPPTGATEVLPPADPIPPAPPADNQAGQVTRSSKIAARRSTPKANAGAAPAWTGAETVQTSPADKKPAASAPPASTQPAVRLANRPEPHNPANPNRGRVWPADNSQPNRPGMIGPVGYDVLK